MQDDNAKGNTTVPNSKYRSISVKLFSKEYMLLETFPKVFATDMITLVECFRRKKAIKLSQDRIRQVEDALIQQNSSLEMIKQKIDGIRLNSVNNFDANTYYDDTRVAAYTEEFKLVQYKHTSRCVYLLPDLSHSIVLDLGCGSGLSTQRLMEASVSTFVIGVDASEAMLRLAKEHELKTKSVSSLLASNNSPLSFCDYVLADFNSPLPFRKNAFDHCSSTSAVHYVHPTRRSSFISEVETIVSGDIAFQLFPKGGLSELQEFRSYSNYTDSCIVIDKPHHKDERTYMLFTRISSTIQQNLCPCGMFPGEISGGDKSLSDSCRCFLSFPRRENVLEEGHLDWLLREHERYFRREERLKRRESMNDAHARVEPTNESERAYKLQRTEED